MRSPRLLRLHRLLRLLHLLRLLRLVRAACADALGVLYPVACIGCGLPDRDLCPACRTRLSASPRHVRLVAGVRCDAVFEYAGLARIVVLGYKVHCRTALACVIGPAFGEAVRAAVDASRPGAIVLRIPPSRGGALRRGFDPVTMALRCGGVRADGVLRRAPPSGAATPDSGTSPGGASPVAATSPVGRAVELAVARLCGASASGQKSRTALERVAATVGSLRATNVAGCSVVLVDDVVTTGTTMAEAVRAVRAAGGTVSRCVAIAGLER